MTPSGSRAAVVTLPSDTAIQVTRSFAASRQLVFRVWTEPELIRRWWPARRGEMTVAEVDLRVGGRWRYVMIAHGEFEVAFHGDYLEVVPGERLVSTEVYEGAPGAAATTTVTFADSGVDGGTTVTILTEHANAENRDLHLNSGMEDGLQDALDDLEQVARSLG